MLASDTPKWEMLCTLCRMHKLICNQEKKDNSITIDIPEKRTLTWKNVNDALIYVIGYIDGKELGKYAAQ